MSAHIEPIDGDPPPSRRDIEIADVRAMVARLRLSPGQWFHVDLGDSPGLQVVVDLCSFDDVEVHHAANGTRYARAIEPPAKRRSWWRR